MLVQTEAYGLKLLVPANDTGVSQCLRDNGEFARVEVELIQSLVNGGVYIDVGANIGSIALPLAKAAKLVIAVEAKPATCVVPAPRRGRRRPVSGSRPGRRSGPRPGG